MESIGGQAVIEGVMIRNKNKIATALMNEKKIIVKKEDFHSLTEKYKILSLPILRGVIGFFETMKIGINTLNYSADIAMLKDEKSGCKKSNLGFYGMMLFAFALALFIFLFLPIFITTRLFNIERTTLYFNAAAGGIRIIFFLIYVYAISFMNDVKRLFMYHGAEHKVVNCYEHGEKITLKNAKKYTTIHKRCGTSFLLVVFITAIIGFSFIDLALFYFNGSTSILTRTISHLLFLPVILGVAYEILKLSSKKKNFITEALVYPGALIQKITTAEPDDYMIKVAIAAIREIV
ncbi:DUF1385 domain-containing protein [Candidatus Woesearchaeota archaeon]|nr:DUF1385 domain-containing protein [Candidatus Woesearchaeota archaeon]